MIGKKVLFLIILGLLIFLAVGCTFLTDWLYPPVVEKPKMSLSIDPKPSYIGEEFEVTVTTRPSGSLSFIRVVLVDQVNNKEIEIQRDNTNRGTFSFIVPSASFQIYAESPYQKIEKDNAVWLPSKTTAYTLPDFSPPSVIVNATRVSPTSNNYYLILNVQEKESNIQSVFYEIDGQRQYLTAKKGEIQVQVPMSIGNHQIKGYATNDSNLQGSSAMYNLSVTPPRVDSKPIINLETVSPVEAFDGEMIYITAQIEDPKSYLSKVEIVSNKGWNRRFNFDPLQENYYLNYLVKVEDSQTLKIKAINGNNISEQEEIEIIKKDHKVPDVELTVTPAGSKFEVGQKMDLEFSASANDSETLTNIFVLVNGSTYRSFMANNSETYSGRITYNLMKGENVFTVVAQDSQGARGSSDPVMVEGEKIDRTPPLIQMLLPNIAYSGVDVELPFTVEDYDSGIAGNPIIKNEDEELNASTFDGYYYIADWTPGATGNYLFTVEVKDNAGNEASETKSVRVKDPTGIVWPTIGELAVTPDPVTLGGSVTVSISVIPPAQDLTINPIVELNVSSPGGNQAGLTNVQKNGNIYSASFSPETKGAHVAQAIVQWDEYQYTRTDDFEVLSPEPTLTFTVEPSQTYIGDDVEIILQTDTSNPYASVTVIEMSVDEVPLTWQTIVNNDQKLYRAQKSTLNLGAGQHVVKVKIRDSFGNEALKIKQFRLVEPTLEINSVNLKPRESVLNTVYKDSYFEVFIERTIPENLPVNGTLQVNGHGVMQSFTLEASGDYRYVTSDWQPLDQGVYDVDISMEAIVNTDIYSDTYSASVTVYPPEIGQPLMRMQGEANTLVYGEGFDFELIFNDPNKTNDMTVKMYLVDESLVQIPEVNPVTASKVDDVTFVSDEPFKIYRPLTFRGAALITVIDISGEYNMPLVYSTNTYTLATPTLYVNLDETKEYYYNLFNSLDVQITVPGTLSIQNPVIKMDGDVLSANPYNVDGSIYSYRIKPLSIDDMPIEIELYEQSDINKQNPLLTKLATLNVVEYNPTINITEMNYGNKVNKSRSPVVQFQLSDTPDPQFYNLEYEYRTTLNTFPPREGNYIRITEDSTILHFNASNYADIDAGNSVELVGNIAIFDGTTRIATAVETEDVTVVLPSITGVRFTNDILNSYRIYTESDVVVEFNNNDYVDEFLNVRLLVSDDGATKVYNKEPDYVAGSVTFDKVVLTATGSHDIQAEVYCNNGNEVLRGQSALEQLFAVDSLPSVNVYFPTELDKIYIGQPIKPQVKITSIPQINDVRISISKDGTAGISNGDAGLVSSQGDSLIYELNDSFTISESGQWTVDALVMSGMVGNKTASGDFIASDGEIENVSLQLSQGGALLFTNEPIQYKGRFSYSNPYNSPDWNATLTSATGASYDISQIGQAVITPNGNLMDYEITYEIGAGVLASGKHMITFSVGSGANQKTTTESFTALAPLIGQPTKQLASNYILEGNKVEGYITYSLSDRFLEEADPIRDYISASFQFDNTGAPIIGPMYEFSDNPPYGKILTITYSAVAGQHNGGPDSERIFNAIFKSSLIDGEVLLDETATFTIKNDSIDD